MNTVYTKFLKKNDVLNDLRIHSLICVDHRQKVFKRTVLVRGENKEAVLCICEFSCH